MSRVGTTTSIVTFLLLGHALAMQAQGTPRPLPTWRAELLQPSYPGSVRLGEETPPVIRQPLLARRSHTGTGLLVGSAIGVAATTIFLIGFCSDTDTECGIDEVGRAALFIAVPTAALGALIGSLIRTTE